MKRALCLGLLSLTLLGACRTIQPETKEQGDPYARYVWPPPPDTPRIRLATILTGRGDVEASSRWQRALLGASPHSPYDFLRKPFACDYDAQGRLWVTDPALHALLRFDRRGRRYDVFGTTGSLALKTPLGLCLDSKGAVYVADAGLGKVVVFSPEGELLRAFGRPGELVNPTDAAVAPSGDKLFVTDSKAHQLVVFDLASGNKVATLGKRGEAEGEFNFPSALAFAPSGHLLVVDQVNARVQILDAEGEVVDVLGGRGVGFGNFVRPKDVAVDRQGRIYVTDAAFNNVQIFDGELRLLTFVGETGSQPGQFRIASGVATWGDEFAVVDQLGRRVQVFRYLPGAGEQSPPGKNSP